MLKPHSFLLLLLLPCALVLAETNTRFVAGGPDPQPGPAGEKPYEMAGRAEERIPIATFDNVAGWIVEGTDAEGFLYATEEQRLYRDTCGKLVYRGLGESPVLVVRPAEPIPLSDPIDCANLWLFGNLWDWVPDPSTPSVRISALLRSRQGKESRIELGRVRAKYWDLLHGIVPGMKGLDPAEGYAFTGLRLEGGSNTEPRTLYLGPLYVYEEKTEPLTDLSLPEDLPFPTRPETILPVQKIHPFSNTLNQDGQSAVFVYSASDATLTYRYTPSKGTLADITLDYEGRTLSPFAGSEYGFGRDIDFGRTVGDFGREALLDFKVADDVASATFLADPRFKTQLVYRLKLVQKSLVIEIECPGVSHLSFGRVEPVANPQVIKVPFLTYGGNDPHVLYDRGLFLHCEADYTYSEASALVGKGATGEGWATINDRIEYNLLTDGSRNPLRDRIFLTASPDFHEVLPTIPNPPSPMKEVMKDRLWRTRFVSNPKLALPSAQEFRFHGGEKVAARFHEDSWRDLGESFTFRTEAAPAKGGDEGLKKFVQDLKDLGWLAGLYTNYTDFAPVNGRWNEDWVARTSQGGWVGAWPRCYAPKPTIAHRLQAELAPIIKQKFDPNHSYCDVHTAVRPWDRVDYDSRTPGAGKFRTVIECFGKLLANERKVYQGPVFSEGRRHWFYAGLVDGNYGQMEDQRPSDLPFLVDFDLLKMHPLEMDAGMGLTSMFFKNGAVPDLDQFIATTLAYGHIGLLDFDGLANELKIYYMIQQIQQRYAMEPVARIEYEDQGGMVSVSGAFESETCTRRRVHVVYANGTEIFVNGDSQPWKVVTPFKEFELPQWGYVGFRPNDPVLVYSANVDVSGPYVITQGPIQRVDLSLGMDQYYADSRGPFAFLGPLALEGAAALKKEGEDWWIIPATECKEFAFAPTLVGASDQADIRIEAVSMDGSPAKDPLLRWSRGLLHVFLPDQEKVKYKVASAGIEQRTMAQSPTSLAPIGGTVPVLLPGGTRVADREVYWRSYGKRYAVRAGIEDGVLVCEVPGELVAGDHVWLGIPSDNTTFWVDYIAVEGNPEAEPSPRKGPDQ